ncbi:hypothetical protein LEP1GSC108_0554 [Leptospira weilii str. UI 13098]|uniref:Uncharacterized protein n=1 Tax=Leptospira weilii str. UI 13098 TaxID=1088542 RepID=M6Q8L0_9LEPT|nr:hypothetical protein LEP1GSC108_0554 [Leptospira weilii str. UI 13098]
MNPKNVSNSFFVKNVLSTTIRSRILELYVEICKLQDSWEKRENLDKKIIFCSFFLGSFLFGWADFSILT